MKSLEMTGTLAFVGEIERFVSQTTGKEFVKRTIAIADDPGAQYPDLLVVTLKKTANADHTEDVADGDVGREVTVTYFPDGRIYTDKLGKKRAMAGNTAWKIEYADEEGKQAGAAACGTTEQRNAASGTTASGTASVPGLSAEDELPF